MKRFAMRKNCSSGSSMENSQRLESTDTSAMGREWGGGQTLMLLWLLTFLLNPGSLLVKEIVIPSCNMLRPGGRGKSRAGNHSQVTISGINGALPHHPHSPADYPQLCPIKKNTPCLSGCSWSGGLTPPTPSPHTPAFPLLPTVLWTDMTDKSTTGNDVTKRGGSVPC